MRQIKDNAQRSGACLIAAEKTQENPVGAETITACDDKSDIVEKMYRAEFTQQMKKQDGSDDQNHSQDQFSNQPLDFVFSFSSATCAGRIMKPISRTSIKIQVGKVSL